MGELIFLAFISVVAIIMFFMASSFPTSIIDNSGGGSLFPKIMVVVLLFFVIIKVLTIVTNKEKMGQKFNFLEIFKGVKLVYLLATIAYFALVTTLGFIIASTLYLIGTIIYFGYLQNAKKPSRKSVILTVSIVIVTIVALDFLFCRSLGIRLPIGLIGF